MGALYLFKEKENGFYQIHCFFGRAIVYYLAENIFFYNCFYHLCFLETFVLISAFCLICIGQRHRQSSGSLYHLSTLYPD